MQNKIILVILELSQCGSPPTHLCMHVHVISSAVTNSDKYIIVRKKYLFDFLHADKKRNKISWILIKLCMCSLDMHQGKNKKHAVGR